MREKEKTTRVIYVRHGETDFPHDRLYCDSKEDPCLNDAGIGHAKQAAILLRHENIDMVYASPIKRTLMTAETITNAIDVPLFQHADLRERSMGIWDGLYFDEIKNKYADKFIAWKKDPVNVVPEDGESIHVLLDRVKRVIEKIVSEHTGKTIAVVSHVGPIRMCITDAMHMPLHLYRQLTIDYGALSCIDYGAHQNNFIYMNFQSRMDP